MSSRPRPIVVVGSLNMDMVSTTDRIPGAGETVVGIDFQLHAGGKGANQAVAAARLGHPVWMLGMVGSDVFGERLRSALSESGVETERLRRMDGPSGTASVVVDARGENSIIVTPGANQQVSPQYVEENEDLLRSAGAVLAQLEIPLEAVECLARLCRRHRVPLVLDPAPAKTLSKETFQGVTWFTPNQTEAQFYAPGAHSDEEILRSLFEREVAGVVLKKGAEGAVLAQAGNSPVVIPSVPVSPVDTTAAGDSFNGGFVVGLLRGLDPVESATFAAAAAAFSVTQRGGQPSMPTQQQVEDLLNGPGHPLS